MLFIPLGIHIFYFPYKIRLYEEFQKCSYTKHPTSASILLQESGKKSCQKKASSNMLDLFKKLEVSSLKKNKHFNEILSLLADKSEPTMEFKNIYTSKTSILGHFWAYYPNFKYVLTKYFRKVRLSHLLSKAEEK